MLSPTAPRSGQALRHEPHIRSLDGLRGVSALLVLFHHVLLMRPDFGAFEWNEATRPRGAFEWMMFETPFRILWAGQERAILFFVLSGFVLSLPWLHSHPRPYAKFLLNRFCRLYPPYLIVMSLAAIGAVFLGGRQIPGASIWFNQLGWSSPLFWHAVPSVLFLINNKFSNWLNESVWSLVWEARVVIIFPLLILPIVRWKNVGIAAVMAGLAVIHPLITITLPHHLADQLDQTGTALLYPEFFIMGVAVALNQEAVRHHLSRRRGVAGLAALVLGLTMFWIHWPVQNSRADGIAAALIVAASLGCPLLVTALQTKLLLWVGRLSYSLYLIHVPLILTIIIVFHGHVPLLACLLAPVLCIVVAELFRRNVEAPSARLAAGWMMKPPPGESRQHEKPQVIVNGYPCQQRCTGDKIDLCFASRASPAPSARQFRRTHSDDFS